MISPAEWPRWNVSLRLAVAAAWPAEPVGVAQWATPRMRARTALVVACIRLLDDDLGLALEDLAVEQLIAKAGVEALDVAVLPGAAPRRFLSCYGGTVWCRSAPSGPPSSTL
jgi:hypothetical protein